MLFSMKYLFSRERIKSALHTLINSCLIPNFFWKNRFFFMYRKRPSLKEWRGRSLLHKNLWSWLSPSWKYFWRPLAPKSNVLEQDFLSTWSAQKLTEFVILWWILKNVWFCDKNWICYVDKFIFLILKIWI